MKDSRGRRCCCATIRSATKFASDMVVGRSRPMGLDALEPRINFGDGHNFPQPPRKTPSSGCPFTLTAAFQCRFLKT